ncbi:MAG TPA: hypothetical protein VFI58_15285 [Xanthobacteraceae bacterium]|jgi:hypothetical protein|nr:hypothetical protein [Xanthobacteraceae bacterium]
MIADRRFRNHLDGCIFAPRWIDLPRALLNGVGRIGAGADA